MLLVLDDLLNSNIGVILFLLKQDLDQQVSLSPASSQPEDNNSESQSQVNNIEGGGGGGEGAENILPQSQPQPQIQYSKIDLDGLLQQRNNSYLDDIFESTVEFNANQIIIPEFVRKNSEIILL